MPPIKPRTMPGTMELLPADQIAFQRMLDTIRRAYERFAFLPIETPVMEFVDLLLTKSGGETEKQVYFAQSSGGRAKGEDPKLALRFDLTVPLARYVAEHEARLVFPFRRYQMQRVYRGESAQKGRFREFYQCDADVVGKDRLSIEYDAEVVALVAAVFGDLHVGDFEIRVNNRKVLAGFLASLGVVDPGERAAVLREVDKLDKVGVDRVAAALGRGGSGVPAPAPAPGTLPAPAPAPGTRPGTGDPGGEPGTPSQQGAEAPLPRLGASSVDRLLRFVEIAGPGSAVVSQLSSLGVDDETFRVGVEELAAVTAALPRYGVPDTCWGIHVAIARGLDYYTGTVCETFLRAHPEIGSVCSGGRYDDLAGYYTKSRLPGVGVSIGATRLFDQLQTRGLLGGAGGGAEVVVLRFAPALAAECLAIGTELRAAGIATEVLLEEWAPKKQLAWASQRGARFAVILGEDEHARGVVALKDLGAKSQEDIARERIATEVATRVGSSA